MASAILCLVHAVMAIVSTVSGVVKGDTCKACNCQFDNVEALNQLIELKIASGKLQTTMECISIKSVIANSS